MIDFNVIVQNLPFISGGLVLTFQLAGIAIGSGLCLGSLLSVARISGRPWIYYPATGKQNDFFVRKMIEIQNFSLWYDKNVQALCGINATIQRGQRLASFAAGVDREKVRCCGVSTGWSIFRKAKFSSMGSLYNHRKRISIVCGHASGWCSSILNSIRI